VTVAYIGESQAKPGQGNALGDFLLSVVAPAVRATHGSESCKVVQSEADPSRFTTIEIWASVEAHRASIRNIPPESIATFMQLVVAPPRGGYYRVL